MNYIGNCNLCYNHDMQDIAFQVNGQTLRGKLFYPEKLQAKNPAILFVHGWTSAKERSYQYAEGLSELGYICFLFDLRGHGESDGNRNTLSSKDFLADVLAAYDHFATIDGVDTDNISVVGSSFGGYLVSLITGKRKVRNIVLRVPADYPNELFNTPKSVATGDNVMQWRKQHRSFNETYALEALHNFQGKVLLIESELDERIPHQTIENYMRAVQVSDNLTYVLMKGTPHSIKEGKFRDEVEQILVEWFGKLKELDPPSL